MASPTSSMNVIIPRRVSRFGDSALTSFILHSLLHLPCLTFSFTYLLLPTESPRRETPMFVFIIVEQNNNRFDESEKG